MINNHDCPCCFEPILTSDVELSENEEMDYSITYIHENVYQCSLCCSEFSPNDIGEENE
jgi:hypothetical protein